MGRRYPTTNQRNTKMIVILMIMIIVIIIIDIIMSMGLPNTPSRSKHAGGNHPTHTTTGGEGGEPLKPTPNHTTPQGGGKQPTTTPHHTTGGGGKQPTTAPHHGGGGGGVGGPLPPHPPSQSFANSHIRVTPPQAKPFALPQGGGGTVTHNTGNHRAPSPSPPVRPADENDDDDVVHNDVDVLFPVWLLVVPLLLCCSGLRHCMFIALFS